VSTKSQIELEKFRDNQRNSDQVQGVHNIKKSTIFKEPTQKKEGGREAFYFQENPLN
jgi:hypothetical protein